MKNKSTLISYYAVMGFFLITLSIPFYFWGFQAFGVVFTTIAISGTTLLVISFYNLYKREEEFNLLYLGYFILILTAIFTSTFGRESEPIQFSIEGTLSLGLSLIAWISFIITAGKSTNKPIKGIGKLKFDKYSSKYKELGLYNPPKLLITKLTRSVLQLFFIHSIGCLLLYPLTIILAYLLPESNISIQALNFLSMEPMMFLNLLLESKIILMAIFTTIIPYLLIFISASNWPRHALRHDQWNSILTILEPLVGLYIGFFIWQESIRSDYVLITTILLIASIILRYFYENGTKIEFILFLKLKTYNVKEIDKQLWKYKKEISRISVVCGQWDVIISASVRSINKLNQIHNTLEKNNLVDKIQYSIVEKVHKNYQK